MDESTEQRLAALERALTDGDHDLSALAEAGSVAQRVKDLEDQLEEYETRIAELEAATQALRGYVGNVRSVNEEVRQQAERALELAEQRGQHTDAEGSGGGNAAPTGVEEPTLEVAEHDQGQSGQRATQAPAEQPQDRTGQSHTSRQQRNTGQAAGQSTAADAPQSQHSPRADAGGQCPLCEGDGTPESDAAGQSVPQTGASDHEGAGPRRQSREGVTDGGTVGDPENGTQEDDDLLRRIRTLL